MTSKFLILCLTIFCIILVSTNSLSQSKIMKNKVAKSADDICPVLVGEKIPGMMLTDIDGKTFNLNSAIKKQQTVLVIYRGGWCPYCSRQLGELRLAVSKLINMGYQVIAVSVDRPAKLKESLDKLELTYTLLSDSDAVAATALGLAFKLDNKTLDLYKRYKIDLEAASGETHHILPVPAVFIIGKDEIIRFEYINPNYKVRLNSDLLLSAAKINIDN